MVHSVGKCLFHKIDEPTREYLAAGELGSPAAAAAAGLHDSRAACQPRAQSVLVGGFKGFPKMAFVPLCPVGPAEGSSREPPDRGRCGLLLCPVAGGALHLSARAWRCTRPPQPWTASGEYTPWT